jgi:hypothetical protein
MKDATQPALAGSPYDLDADAAYRRWRAAKLDGYPTTVEAIVVAIGDPRRTSEAERRALLDRLRKTNMVIYAGTTGSDPDKSIPARLGERFGLSRLDHNWLADGDGLTSLTVSDAGERPQYIPYTNRAINWHTDGYYNPPERRVQSLMLHCVHAAAEGGANALLDHEIAYILLRDEDPAHIAALMQPDAMTIPPGTDAEGGSREATVGPVFLVNPDGSLHMRFTARRRNVTWKDDPAVIAARDALLRLLDSDCPYIFRARLESGMGLISNNVLHDRTGFTDRPGHPARLLYRARYVDRVAGT